MDCEKFPVRAVIKGVIDWVVEDFGSRIEAKNFRPAPNIPRNDDGSTTSQDRHPSLTLVSTDEELKCKKWAYPLLNILR